MLNVDGMRWWLAAAGSDNDDGQIEATAMRRWRQWSSYHLPFPLAIIQISNENRYIERKKNERFRNACCSLNRWEKKKKKTLEIPIALWTGLERGLHARQTQNDHISFELIFWFIVRLRMRECVLKSIAGSLLLFQPPRYEMKPFHFSATPFAVNGFEQMKKRKRRIYERSH